ncbi:MAG: arsenate reductase ArsC [Chloroflexi bacterium]|nr:arsenate reductase ArsC [Chloroflexota bacterium]
MTGTVERPIRVLFVCTHNSARSIMAEAVLRREGGGAFEPYSAGTEATGVNPLTMQALEEAGIDAPGARSKSVTEFYGQSFDYVITVCDRARESCPVFPGANQSLHWGFDDPSEATGTDDERMKTFRRVLTEVTGRVKTFALLAGKEQPAQPAPLG